MTPRLPAPGWYQDPTEQSGGRYWNGSAWTESVLQAGVVVDVPVDPGQAQLPPLNRGHLREQGCTGHDGVEREFAQ